MITKIVFTGPESTGKSTLAKAVSQRLGLPMLDEYARIYLKVNGINYTEKDVDEIGKGQEKMEDDLSSKFPLVILDTDWTVIEIWKNIVYNTSAQMSKSVDDKLYFLCYPDVHWEYDEMRENPYNRLEIYEAYLNLLDGIGATYYILEGELQSRIDKVIETIQKLK